MEKDIFDNYNILSFFGLIPQEAVNFDNIQILVHCIATWCAMSRSLVTLTEIGTSWGVARQWPNSWILQLCVSPT